MRRRFRRRVAAFADPSQIAAELLNSPEFRKMLAVYVLECLDMNLFEDSWANLYYKFIDADLDEAYTDEYGESLMGEVSKIIDSQIASEIKRG